MFIEEILYAGPIELLGHESINYKFVYSKDERLVHVSDLNLGVLRYWMAFLESVSIRNLRAVLNTVSEFQKVNQKKL